MPAMLDPHGPGAASIANLAWVLFGICGAVYVIVVGVLLWAIARRGRNARPSPRLDIVLTRTVVAAAAITALIVSVLTVASVAAERHLTSPSGPGAITVDVVGYQWWWDFQFRDVTPSDRFSSPNELHIPVGVPIHLQVSSRDVIHSFWVPTLHGKRDLIPGITTTMWIQADTPGVFRGQCAEFCGYQHAHMAVHVVAEPMPAFLTWIRNQRMAGAEPASAAERRGRDVFMTSACVLCHTIRGTAAGSRVGPELTHVATRATVAAGTLVNTDDNLRAWIRNPHAFKPGTRMPGTDMSNEDLDAVVAYVRSLR